MIGMKDRFSAFLPASSDIEQRLRDADIDTVVIVGTLTNVCCESSARDAMMRNFKVIMASDANATLTDEEHTAALATIFQVFGDVMTCDEVITLLENGSATQHQPQHQAAE
jgi:ureidoacrylate peracid hydrolase